MKDIVQEIVQGNKNKLNLHKEEFQRVFSVPLHRFMHPLFGFDVIAFDENFIKPTEGQSTADKVESVYGKDALKLIESLIASGS